MSETPVVLITGANSGLGAEAVKALCRQAQPYHILVGSRKLADGEATIAAIQREQPTSSSRLSAVAVDVSSDESIAALRDHIQAAHGRLDVLVNNAGVSPDLLMQEQKLSARDGWRQAWDVNVVGAHVLTETMVPLLLEARKSATTAAAAAATPRVLFITSGTSALADTERMDGAYANINAAPPAGWPKAPVANPNLAYRSTKAGMNMMMRQWHRLLSNDGIKVFAVSPGFLATGFLGIPIEKVKQMGAIEPSVGGNFVKDVIMGERDADAGKAINAKGIQVW